MTADYCTPTPSRNEAMSDRLALSAALSVLMMTAYVLFGVGTQQTGFATRDIVSVRSLPSLQVVLARTDARRILY